MSFESCLISERLTAKLPIAELRELAKKYTRVGMTPDGAMALVLKDKLELAKMEERAIIKAVRSAWEAKGGKPRPARAAAPAEVDPAPTAKPEQPPGQDVAALPDLNEMFLELLAEEAGAKPASDDLNAMFTELLAEESGVDPRPTVADVVAGPKKPRRVRAKNAFATLEQEAERLPHLYAIHKAKYWDGKGDAEHNKKVRRAIAAAEKELAFYPPGILTPEAMYNVRGAELATPEGRLEAARSMVESLEMNARTALDELARGDWKDDAEAWADFTKKHKHGPHMTRAYFDMLGAGVDVEARRGARAKDAAEEPAPGNEWTKPDPKRFKYTDDVDYALGKPIKKLTTADVYPALTKNPAITVKVAERITLLRPDLKSEVNAVMRDELAYVQRDGQWTPGGKTKLERIEEAEQAKKGKTPYQMVEEVNENWRKLHAEHRQWFTGDGPYKLKSDAPADVQEAYKAHLAAKKAAQDAMDAPARTKAVDPDADALKHIRKFAKKPGEVKNEQVRKLLLDAGPMAAQVAAIVGEEGHLVTEVGRVMDEFGYKFVNFDGLRPIFEKPGAKAEERSAGEAAVSAAKSSAAGFAAAIAGLGEIFGANIDGKMGIVDMDESKYQRALPYFVAAVKHFQGAAGDIREVMRAVIKAIKDQFGYQATANMQPYIVRFTEEYRAGKHQGEKTNATDRTTDRTARDQEHRPDGNAAAERDIFHVEPAVDGKAPAAEGQPDEAGTGQRDSTGVSGRGAAPTGAQGDQRVRAPESGPDGRAAEPRDSEGSGRPGRAGARPDAGPGRGAADVVTARPQQGDKLDEQRKAAAVQVKLGDRANIDATLPYLLEGQRDDVAFAEKRFTTPGKMPGVLFTNGTGTGKTGTGTGIIARMVRAGKTEGLVVVPNKGIANDWIEFAARLGVTIKLLDSTTSNGGKGACITTYANFGENMTLADREYDWLIADESHTLLANKDGESTDYLATFRALTRHPAGFATYARMKNRALYDQLGAIANKESAQAKALFAQIRKIEEGQQGAYAAIAQAPAKRPKAVFLSATPFAHIKSVDYAEGYLFEYPADGKIGNSNQDGHAKFFVQHFGYRIRYHKLTEPDGNVDKGLMARQFNNWLKAEGALSGRTLEVEADYGRRFIQVESALGAKIDEGMEFMREHPEYKHLYQPFMKEFTYLRRRYLLEAIKAKEALPAIQQHLDLGRKVVVVHDYKKGGAFNPFHMTGINGTSTSYDADMKPTEIDLAELAEKFKAERPDLVRLQFPAANALATLRSAYPNALVHNGDIPEKQLEANKRLFNDDTSGRNLIILQSDKGREGISLHDTTGAHQRVTINIGMPAKPTAFTQLEGRTYRNGQVSDAVFDYIVTGTMWERWTFAQTIAERADIVEALAMGDDARGLKDAIIEAFEDAQAHDITAGDGKGGKARDRQAAKLMTDWDRARSFYYGQLKRNSSTKALEGKDYFATPEPLGLKMVEWADIRPGEDVLEPSAGHGAIARWFPTLSNKTINEMETELITRARLAVDGQARFLQGRFEDVNIVNKFDAIVMNPPFGLGGSMAIPHVKKAYQHLRDGGRIVALLPKGPSADAKLEKFLYGEDAPKDLYMVADIELPSATFERAGTSVRTHIVILDKISDPAKAPHQVNRSFESAEDIEEFFDRIQHSTVPGRVKTQEPIDIALEQQKKAPKKQPREAAPDAQGADRYYAQFEFKHTKTGEDRFGAAMLNRVSMDTYKEVLAIAKSHGGWYNTFTGGGALRGFLFKSAEDRTAFMAEAGEVAEVSAGLAGDEEGGLELRDLDRRKSERDTPERRVHTIQVEGKRRPIENSRGQVLAEDMNKQLAFYRWFKDSAVVDEQQRPLVVYHGTAADFDAFDMGNYSKNFTGDYGVGFYFTQDAKSAGRYADSASFNNGDQGANIMPVYLSMQNPKIVKAAYADGDLWSAVPGAKTREELTEGLKAQGYDGVIVDGGRAGVMYIKEAVVFSPEQIKSAVGNNGQFDPENPSILADLEPLPLPLMLEGPLARAEEPKRVATTAKLKKYRRQLEKGEITAEQLADRVGDLIGELDERNATRGAPKERERGVEWVTERLMRARRLGEIDRGAADFALWALEQAPHLAEDLGISIRAGGSDGTAGRYNPVSRVITLFKGSDNSGTAVHEILHHAERMMPAALQNRIVKAWGSAWARAYAKADEATRALLSDMLEMASDKKAAERVIEAFGDGRLDYDQHYQLANPSEYWAVNATRLMEARYGAGSWMAKARRWMAEFIEKAKGFLGLASDAPILAGLRAVMDGTGERISPRMLVEQAGLAGLDLRNINRRRQLPTPAWAAPAMTTMDNVRHALQDKHIDTKRTVAAVREAIGDLGDKWNPYLQEELYHGRSATGFKDFLENELRPLLSDLQARDVTLEQLEEFLHMRHAEEANDYLASINDGAPDGLAGVSTQDAKDYLANLAPAQRAKLEALANRVDAIIKGTQRTLVSYGLEKQESVDAWNASYKHYVPLHREDMDKGQLGNGTGSGFSVRGPATKARVGSKRAVVDILANIAMQRESAIVRGEKNRIAMALYGLALQAPNPGFWKPINPQKNPAALDAELLNMGLSPAEKRNIVDEPRSKRIGQLGMVESYVNMAARAQDHVVAVRINGEDRFIFFNKQNDRAMRMAQAMKNRDEDQLGWAMGHIATGTRFLAAMNTQYNPVFGAVNLVRDLGEGSINLSSTPIAGKQGEVLAEAGVLLLKVIRGKGRMSSLSGADAALWNEFQAEGGITGYRAMFARSEDRMKELRDELARMQAGPAGQAYQATKQWLSDYNEALENITRLSAYKVAKASGMSNQQAASLAKNLTVNFNRKGAKTRIIGALYAFFNAAAQGTTRMLETLNSPAGKKIIAGGLLLGVLQAAMLAMCGFDDEDIPEFVRSKNLIIPASLFDGEKDYYTIPLPLGFSFLPSIGRIGTEFAIGGMKHPGRYGTRLLSVLLDTFNPLDSSTPLQMVSFTVTDPLAALAENKDWTGKDIALLDHSKLKPTPGHTRVKETASWVGKGLSTFFNAATGGTEYSPGAFSPTPDQIDYFIGQLAGGVGREAMKLQQSVGAAISGEEVSWNKVPFFGRFVSDANDKSARSTKFYNNIRELSEHAAEVMGRRKDGIDTAEYKAENPEAKLAKRAENVLERISDLNRSRRKALEKGERARVKELELSIRRQMDDFNNDVAKARSTAQ